MGLEARWRCGVCRQKRGSLLPSNHSASTPKCYNTRVLRHQSATTPECYDTRVLPVHQSGASSMTLFWWHTEAWVAVGGTQRSSRRNGNGDSEEIQTVIREKYKHRRHGELGLDWEEMGGGGKLNIIEWEIYLGNLPKRQKVPDNYFFPLERFVFPSVRKNEA